MSRLFGNSCRDISQQYQECRQIEETDYHMVERMERIERSYEILYGECGRGLGTWQPFIKRDRIDPLQRTNNITMRRNIDTITVRTIAGTGLTGRLSESPIPVIDPIFDSDPMHCNPLIHYDWDTDVLGIGDYNDDDE